MSVAVPSYIKKYLRMSPQVTQIFDDLEDYVSWAKLQYPSVKIDEADLYNSRSPLWQKYCRYRARLNKRSAKKE